MPRQRPAMTLRDLRSIGLTPPPLPDIASRQYSFPEFTPQKMVDWFSPLELARTGGRVVLASIFGSYADKREVQAALYQDEDVDKRYLKESQLWFDYVADIGDGFNSTYTMAYLLALPELEVADKTTPRTLKRGQLLFLGGDQVYPTASREAYRSRMIGPYSLASPEPTEKCPEQSGSQEIQDLYAIPGNHDWYDGLTSFVRTFCQRRTLGSWHTRQLRSYFSVALPFNWWVWGIDIQLEADIDDPQLRYFEKMAADHARQKVGDHHPKLIIVTAEPAWVYCGVSRGFGTIVQKNDAFENLKFFLKETVWKHGIDLRLVIAGDLHHYARYSRESRPGIFGAAHLVTAGGGGAYLSATHHLHGTVRVPVGMTSDGKPEEAEFCLNDRRYPSESKSLLHSFGCLMLPLLSPSFALLMALTYLLLAWQLQSGSRADCGVPNMLSPATEVLGKCWETPLEFNAGSAVRHFSLMDALTEGHSLSSAVQWQAGAFQEGPSILVTLLILWFLLYAFCDASSKTRFFLTTAHLFSHVLAVSIGVWIAASVVPWVGSYSGLYSAAGSFYAGVGRATVFGVHMFVYGAIVGPLLFAAYLWLSAHCVIGAPHMNEVFSSRRFQDCKHFLRFHLQPDGRIQAVVVGVEWVSRLWRVRDDGEGAPNQEKAWYQPLLKARTHVVDTFWLDFEDRSRGATAEARE